VAVPTSSRRPEVLAPAGDEESLKAAVKAGADAVYFGLQGFNARARARNFDAGALRETLAYLHQHGVKGYVTLNTLLFDEELAAAEQAVRTCAEAGVDAVIVQDLGMARLVKAVAPALPIHASTQMTCTDAASVELAASLGADRVILARELSVDDIAQIRARTDVELEVFVHGALCIAYSGQCLTSEAIGGRSANRGACAQACRLPYDLIVDGETRDVGERAYLLSPEDLEASALVPRLSALGVASVKIEGRLKQPEYVAATTRLYRAALDAEDGIVPEEIRERALQMYSRGSGPGFLGGVDHRRLVEGRACDHRGLEVGVLERTQRRGAREVLVVRTSRALSRGDGLLVEGGHGGSGELGGRVWALTRGGRDVTRAEVGDTVEVWLGPDVRPGALAAGRRVFRNDDPALEKSVRAELDAHPARVPIDLVVRGDIGEPPQLEATARGRTVRAVGDTPIDRARNQPTTTAVLRDQLGRMGDTPFELRDLGSELPGDAMISLSSLNRARRALVAALLDAPAASWPTTEISHAELLARCVPPDRAPPPRGLFVLCRTAEQARAALSAGADGVYLDFLELTGTGEALRALRESGAAHVGVAPPRIRKPGEEKIDRYLGSLAPDSILVRGLGALHEGGPPGAIRIGDFSLNVTNRITAHEVLSRGCSAFTPSFDLDAAQLVSFLSGPFAPYAEVVVHHPMPLFHMEHCVIAALLGEGADYRTCGRPCDRHQISLRDRAGMVHPVEADVGCRNTVFHGAAQSAAGIVPALQRSGVGRFRIELVRERADEVVRLVTTYRALLDGTTSAAEVFRTLRAEGGYGVVRGSLRTLTQPA
jgi:U32 family peptidase